jgi:peptidoglycan hydrolase-like protein with peptidoglycan-binding domain
MKKIIWSVGCLLLIFFLFTSEIQAAPSLELLSGSYVLYPNQTGTWVWRGSDPELRPLTYYVDWRDGTLSGPTTTPIFSHSYSSPALYVPIFTAINNAYETRYVAINIRVSSTTSPLPTSFPTPLPTPTTCYLFKENFGVGTRNGEVAVLQKYLYYRGFLMIDATTGYYGEATRSAVAAYQKANGIYPAEGYFGTLTRTRVNSCGIPTSTPTLLPTPLVTSLPLPTLSPRPTVPPTPYVSPSSATPTPTYYSTPTPTSYYTPTPTPTPTPLYTSSPSGSPSSYPYQSPSDTYSPSPSESESPSGSGTSRIAPRTGTASIFESFGAFLDSWFGKKN